MSAKQMQRLLEITRELGKLAGTDPYLQSLLSAGVELTNSETASILEYDPGANELRFLAVPWVHRDSLRSLKVPVEGSAAGWVIRTRQPLIIADIKNDTRHFREADRVSEYETRSLLAVPLLHHGQPIGVFEALNKADDAYYTEEDATVLETLAVLVSQVMRNDVLERRMQSTYDEMAELDRLKKDFIAITSHELRTPLGLILGYATFLRETVGREYREQIDAIIRNASKLKETIETLASVDNYQSGAARLRQRRVSMARIIEDVAASFEELAKQKDVRLSIAIGGDKSRASPSIDKQANGDLPIEADADKIAIALSNLVKNAIVFTDAGGHVSINAESVPGFVKVSIMDDGIGIPPKDLPRIFERFFQVESHLTRRHGGMGLGLSVAKVMIEMHGGRIWAESVEGKGSNFTFLLPLDPAQADVDPAGRAVLS